MGANRENQELFYCRSGMLRRGPFTRKTLRKLLAAGLLDAHSLVGVVGSKVMMPLGSSKAAGEITWVARHWYWQHTVWMYWAWLVFMPLFSAGVSGGAIIYSSKAAFLIPSAIILGNLGMALWLYQKWSMLLADRKNGAWLAAFYALPMAIPVVNFVWIWIGYLKLPKHWRSFKQLHNIPDHTPYFMYYLVMVVFYLMFIGEIVFFCVDDSYKLLCLHIFGSISWLWYGLTLMSLFLTDHITLLLIKSKLRNLAFGAVSCCADINYDTLHQAVMALARRASAPIVAIGGLLLLCSWVAGGWIWISALECWFIRPNDISLDWLIKSFMLI